MHDNFPEGFDVCFPSKKVQVKVRGQLDGHSIFQEFHCDGHEKLSSKALHMGPVGFEIYGMCCHTSGAIMFMEVVPNARCQYTVAHCYLDILDVTGSKSTVLAYCFILDPLCRNASQDHCRWRCILSKDVCIC